MLSVVVHWLREAWSSRRLWRVPDCVVSTVARLTLADLFGHNGLRDFRLFRRAYVAIDWSVIPLVDSWQFAFPIELSPGHMYGSGDWIGKIPETGDRLQAHVSCTRRWLHLVSRSGDLEWECRIGGL